MQRFSKAEFSCRDDDGRRSLSAELAALLTVRLKDEKQFHQGVQDLVAELRQVGHDLWSFDESDEMEVWCPNYQNPTGPGLVVTFTTDGVEVEPGSPTRDTPGK